MACAWKQCSSSVQRSEFLEQYEIWLQFNGVCALCIYVAHQQNPSSNCIRTLNEVNHDINSIKLKTFVWFQRNFHFMQNSFDYNKLINSREFAMPCYFINEYIIELIHTSAGRIHVLVINIYLIFIKMIHNKVSMT